MELAGILLLVILAFIILVMIIRAILGLLFRGVAKVGSAVAYGTVRAVAGEEYARQHERGIRNAGAVLGAVGGALLVGDLMDGGLDDSADGILDAADAWGDPSLIAGTDHAFSPLGSGIDLSGDGIIDGFDSDADGLIDTNVIGNPTGPLNTIDGYTKLDGTIVEGYQRTLPDSENLNNLRPLA